MRHFLILVATLVCVSTLMPSPLLAKTQEEKLIKQLRSFDHETRSDAAWDLGRVGGAAAVPALVAALQDDVKFVRANAAASLYKLSDVAQSAIPALKNSLDDPYGLVVANAATALHALGLSRAELAPTYRRLLADPECRVRLSGVRGLEKQVPPEELFPTTLECSRMTDIEIRLDAGEILRRLIEDRSMVPVMIEALKLAGDAEVGDLLRGLAAFKPRVEEAIPVMIISFNSPESLTRVAAASSLGRMQAVSAVPGLIKLLESDPDFKVRKQAAKAIGEMKASAAEAIPALVNSAQHDKWPDVQQAALWALGEMREAARDAIPVLYAALEDDNAHTRVAARNALFRIDPKNKAKAVEIVAARAAAPPVGGAGAHLFDDISGLPKVLTEELPVAFALVIYEDFAMITADESTSSTGWGEFTYRDGAIIDRRETRPTCKKTIRFAEVDLTLVPNLVKDSLQRAGGDAKVSHVYLGPGIFCKKFGWGIYMANGARASRIEYKLDGKLKKVWP